MKKQILLLVMMLSMAANAFAVEAEIDGLWYELVSKAKEAKVIQYKNNVKYTGDIVIPETVNYEEADYSVTSIGNNAFYGCNGLISVTIPNSVTSIGGGAFWNCSSLISANIPNSVTSIENRLFSGCKVLNSITIPNGVTSIGENAFNGCKGLTSITIPNSVTNIKMSAFEGCSGLTSITIPNSVTSIGLSAFSNCSNLTSLEIPNSVTSILHSVFKNCSNLSSLKIPNSVTSIGQSAFEGCSGLIFLAIPNSVTSIGWDAFSSCGSLTSITIGSGVKTISGSAFAKCPELTDVYCYAESVPSTNTDAFSDSYVEYATLHVPTASIEAYKATEPWNSFKSITSKCAKPTISYVGGKVKFSCETEGVEFVSEVTVGDAKKNYTDEVSLTGVYQVSVYATKAGFDNSDVATKEINVRGLKGDANSDGEVDIADAVHIVNFVVGKIKQLAPQKDMDQTDPE